MKFPVLMEHCYSTTTSTIFDKLDKNISDAFNLLCVYMEYCYFIDFVTSFWKRY